MTEHGNPEPPATFRYAAGAGLGLLVGVAVGLFIDADVVLPAGLVGMAVGILVAFFVKFTKP